MYLTFSSIVEELKLSVQNLMVVGPIMCQYFWYIRGCIPLGPGALESLKKKTVFLISTMGGGCPTLGSPHS